MRKRNESLALVPVRDHVETALSAARSRFRASLAAVTEIEQIPDLQRAQLHFKIEAASVAGRQGLVIASVEARRLDRRTGELIAGLPAMTKAQAVSRRADRRTGSESETVVLSKKERLESVRLTEKVGHELQKIASLPEDAFEHVLSEAEENQEEATRAVLLRAAGSKPANFSSESVEWYTPPKYLDAAREALGTIDLDPASSTKANKAVRADRIFTATDNGLEQEWSGRIWLNPPYGDSESGGTGAWVTKLVEEVEAKRTEAAILLVNAVTDRKWFQPIWGATALCFTNHRIEFYTPNGAPKQPVSGNVFAYWGKAPARFRDAFSVFGAVVTVMS